MRFLVALAAGAAGYFYFLGRQLQERRALAQEEAQRWEAEGGSVPAASPADGPAASVAPGATDPTVH